MNVPYPIIQIPERSNRIWKKPSIWKTSGFSEHPVNPARQYKKAYCKTFGITGAKFHKIRKLQRRILRHVDIST